MATRRQRQAEKHAAGRGKGHATPKRPPAGRTRAQQTAMLSRRARRELAAAPGAAERAVGLIRGAKAEEKTALERLLRDAGGVVLRRGGHRG